MKPEKMIIDHQEDGQECGCVSYEEETPCEMIADSFNRACDLYEDREKALLEEVIKHYYIYGYEKQSYIKEILEQYLGKEIEVS